MAGHSQHPRVISEAGRVQVSAANTGQTLLDGRVPRPDEEALAKIRKRVGPLIAGLEAQAEQFGAEFRTELNQRAGGQAPPSVMAEAQIIQDLMVLRRGLYLLAGTHFGKISEAEVDADIQQLIEMAEKTIRTGAGVSVVLKDLFNNAREQANDFSALAPTLKSTGQTQEQTLLASLGLAPANDTQEPEPA